MKEKIGFQPKYKQLDYFFNSYNYEKRKQHYLIIEENHKKGLVDGYGNQLLKTEYDAIKKEFHYLELTQNNQTGIFFLATHKVVFSDFNKIKTAIELDDDFVVLLVENKDSNSVYYVGQNGVIYKN